MYICMYICMWHLRCSVQATQIRTPSTKHHAPAQYGLVVLSLLGSLRVGNGGLLGMLLRSCREIGLRNKAAYGSGAKWNAIEVDLATSPLPLPPSLCISLSSYEMASYLIGRAPNIHLFSRLSSQRMAKNHTISKCTKSTIRAFGDEALTYSCSSLGKYISSQVLHLMQ